VDEDEPIWDEEYEEDEEDSDGDEGYQEFTKPEATRLLLDQEATKKFIEKNCCCHDCNGPVELKAKTICLASSLMICLMDEDCGYVDHSVAPVPAQIGETMMKGQGVLTMQSMPFTSFRSSPTEMAALRQLAYLVCLVYQMILLCKPGHSTLSKTGQVHTFSLWLGNHIR
jgi:hypothetical protein